MPTAFVIDVTRNQRKRRWYRGHGDEGCGPIWQESPQVIPPKPKFGQPCEVIATSNQTGADTTWSREYDYAQIYHEAISDLAEAFGVPVSTLIRRAERRISARKKTRHLRADSLATRR